MPVSRDAAVCLPTCNGGCSDGLECVDLGSGSYCIPPAAEPIGFEEYYESWPRRVCDWIEQCLGAGYSEWYYTSGCEATLARSFHDGENELRADLHRGVVTAQPPRSASSRASARAAAPPRAS